MEEGGGDVVEVDEAPLLGHSYVTSQADATPREERATLKCERVAGAPWTRWVKGLWTLPGVQH